MINDTTSILGLNGNNQPSRTPRSEEALTESQQTLISEKLAEFDPDNLSESDALSIVESFSEAGIQPGKSLESAMSALGFDAKTIGDLANQGQGGSNMPEPPPLPKQSSEEISSMVEYLAELLEEKLAENNNDSLTDEDKQSVLAKVFERFDIDEGKSIINTSA